MVRMDPFTSAMAAVVRADMLAAGLSVNALSESTGIPRITLTRRLAGAPFTTAELSALADRLGTSVSAWTHRAELAVA